ncbi:hypothetical protein D3C86_1755920 [compost metagenome]
MRRPSRVPLPALNGVGQRALKSPFGDRDALYADMESRGVHHDEHVGEALVLLSDQLRPRSIEHHHAGG